MRHMICIATGSCGVARTEAAARRVSRNLITREYGLLYTELTTSMCPRGHQQLEQMEYGITMQSIRDSQEIMMYIGRHASMTMNELMKSRDISKLVSKSNGKRR